MVMPTWVKTVSDWLPVIQLVGVILLWKYVIDTAAMRMATLAPFLILDQKLRDADNQILSQSHQPTPATELAENLLIRNIGTGPAFDVVYIFDGVEHIETWRSSIPYLKAGQATELAIPKNSIKQRDIMFRATYSSLARVRFQSRQVLSEGVLGSITVKKLGIFRRSFAFLKRVELAIRANLKERQIRKRIAALYP